MLFEAAVQVADVGAHVLHHLAVRLELQPEHAVGARVLGTHVERHQVALEVVVAHHAFGDVQTRLVDLDGGRRKGALRPPAVGAVFGQIRPRP